MTALDAIGALALVVAAMIVHPDRASCPRGMWLSEGIRRSGHFACTAVPIGGDQWNGHGWVDRSIVMPGVVESLIYCTGGSIPIQVDGVRVGCQARH